MSIRATVRTNLDPRLPGTPTSFQTTFEAMPCIGHCIVWDERRLKIVAMTWKPSGYLGDTFMSLEIEINK